MTTQKQKARNIQEILEYFINREQGNQGDAWLRGAKQELFELITQNDLEVSK